MFRERFWRTLNAIRAHVRAGLRAERETWRRIVRDPERTYWRQGWRRCGLMSLRWIARVEDYADRAAALAAAGLASV